MEKAIDSSKPKASHRVEDDLSNEADELLLTLPREKNFDGTYLYQFNGVWYHLNFLYGMISTRRHFQARDSDIIVSTFPKSGTTWLKALTYAIVHRSRCAFEHSPLLTTNPYELVPFFETSLDNSHKILFLKYEDLKEDTYSYVNKLAEFLGCPFSNVEENERVIEEIVKLCSFENIKDSNVEEKERVIEEIVKLCSFENMKDLEVNKPGRNIPGHESKNSDYFRKGEVGDWANYLTPSMSERLKNLMEEKFSGSGLAFKLS
ncbi:hypothetical protein LWI28_026049 [Acer negundo]|uniref:Sulfotransferase n=1 Tax=Acer negundo TaxID=4023 RepID=A0AAD5JRJ9_ACENE|nr:hypothetical protein LWI28_026049 [Acer negundo]